MANFMLILVMTVSGHQYSYVVDKGLTAAQCHQAAMMPQTAGSVWMCARSVL